MDLMRSTHRCVARWAPLVVLCATTSAQTPLFGPAANLPVGTFPQDLSIADLNGDGVPDVVTADRLDSTVTILLGTGGGSFAAGFALNVGLNPIGLAIGDLGGDGIPDLAVASLGSLLTVLTGDGSGSFGGLTQYSAGPGAHDVVIADFDGNGVPDLAVTNNGGSSVSILLGTGGGLFGTTQTVGTPGGPRRLAAGDLDGDGALDLAVSCNTTLAVLFGTGSGGFNSAVNYPAGTTPMSVAVADLDADGALDLVVPSSVDDAVAILMGDGGGSFAAPALAYLGSGHGPLDVAVDDLDGDGALDLAIGNGSVSSVTILLGAGNGTFGTALGLPVSAPLEPVQIADLDGDGRLDLATASPSGDSVSILLNINAWIDQGSALPGVSGAPLLVGVGPLADGSSNSVDLGGAAASAAAALFSALSSTSVPFKGGTLLPFPFLPPLFLTTDGTGAISLPFVMPSGVPSGTELWLQWAIQDGTAAQGVALSNAIRGSTP